MPALEDALRIAASIVFETLALVVWNVGSRSPRRLYDDLRLALASLRGTIGALAIGLLGTIFFMTAIVLLVPALVEPRAEFSPVAIGTLVVALLADFLVGNDLRALVFARRDA